MFKGILTSKDGHKYEVKYMVSTAYELRSELANVGVLGTLADRGDSSYFIPTHMIESIQFSPEAPKWPAYDE